MAGLLEAYAKRLSIAEGVYSKSHTEAMPQSKKLVLAKVLDNTSKFLNEAFNNSVGTQRADLGAFKRFCLNLVNVALPNLIAFDLVMVQPMSSFAGNIAYVKYVAGSRKGGIKQGHVFNDPFRLGQYDKDYTADRVVEEVTTDGEGKATLAWAPIVNNPEPTVDAEGNPLPFTSGNPVGAPEVVGAAYTVVVNDAKTGAITVMNGSETVKSTKVKIKYLYDNVIVPQNDLPILNAQMANIPLTAKTRRIAVYYSQIAAYQAKQDYGFDLADQLAQQAVGQLNYEIDTEVCQLLIDNADSDADLVWSKTLPVGVSKQEHYAAFTEVIEMAKQKVYDRTKRYAPNYMLIASNLMPILSFIPDFSKASTSSINGPYFAGTLDGIKVYVTPAMEPGKFVLGVHQGDFNTSAAVYAPYMPVVPTQLLQFADGANSQGWSTVYGLALLNKDLLVAGRITA